MGPADVVVASDKSKCLSECYTHVPTHTLTARAIGSRGFILYVVLGPIVGRSPHPFRAIQKHSETDSQLYRSQNNMIIVQEQSG